MRTLRTLAARFGFGLALLVSPLVLGCAQANDAPETAAEVSETVVAPLQRTILVAGATGRQGGAVARELLSRGYPVRALTRDSTSDRAHELRRLGADVVQGDLDDRASLDRAVADAYGVFSMQNFWEHGYEGEVRQGKALANAARGANVRHFVYSSVGSADRQTGISHFDSKYEIEEHVRASGLPFTILRPVAFMDWESAREEILAGRLRSALSPARSMQYIDVNDIGVFAAEAFDDPDNWLGRELDIAGDELTMTELAEVFGRVTGEIVEYGQIPWSDIEAGADPEITGMLRWFEATGYDADVDDLRRRVPALISVEAHLRRTGWEPPPG